MFVAFNRPQPPSGGSDSTLANFLLDCFRSAGVGSRITGLMYHWSDTAFTNTLRGIRQDRSLKFRFAAGDSGHGIPNAVEAFFDTLDESTNLRVRPFQMRNHNKWFVFDDFDFDDFEARTGRVRLGSSPSRSRALYIANGNLSSDDRDKHNAAAILPITKAIADDLKARFRVVQAAYLLGLGAPYVRNGTNFYETSESSVAKVYQFPRKPFRTSTDVVRSILKNVRHYSAARSEPCVIRLVTPRWSDDRLGVAEVLTRIQRNGGVVEIVARGRDKVSDQDGDGQATPEMGSRVARELKKCATRWFEAPNTNIHSKYLLVDAPYKQEDGSYVRERLVWVGSPNLTRAGLSGSWETLVKLKPVSGAFDAFLEDFEYLKANATAAPRAVGT